MLYSLYQKILQILEEEFSGFGLDNTNFGMGPSNHENTFFTVEEKNFVLKVPILRKSETTRILNRSEKFTVPSQKADKNGPYYLASYLSQIEKILVIENPGSEKETSIVLNKKDYKTTSKTVSILQQYKGGTLLIINYKTQGFEFSDRFDLRFALKIFERDPVLLEQFSLLAIPAIWGNLHKLTKPLYLYTVGTLQTKINIKELLFKGQSKAQDIPFESCLNFVVSGNANFAKSKIEGDNILKQIVLSKRNGVVHNKKGDFMGFKEI